MTDQCPHCDEPVLLGERVVETNGGALSFHVECMMRMIAGSVGHQTGRCSCYGGTEDDPPGMTRREAARAAYVLLMRRQGGTPSITCPFCGLTSYHPQDVIHRYCGRCHRFLDDPKP